MGNPEKNVIYVRTWNLCEDIKINWIKLWHINKYYLEAYSFKHIDLQVLMLLLS